MGSLCFVPKDQKKKEQNNKQEQKNQNGNPNSNNQQKYEVKEQELEQKNDEKQQNGDENQQNNDDEKDIEASHQIDNQQNEFNDNPGGASNIRKNKNKKNKLFHHDQNEEVQILEKIKKIPRMITQLEEQFIIKSLGTHFVFNQLRNNEKQQIAKQMFYCENTEDFLFMQGDQASCYFIIEKGECEIIIDNKVKKVLGSGSCFGELALLYGANRSTSVKAVGLCGFWAIDRKSFQKAVHEILKRNYEETRSFIDSVEFFSNLTKDQKDSIANVLITQQFKQDECIVNYGDQASSFYIIKQGVVNIIIDNRVVKQLNARQTFGEQALYTNSTRAATVIAGDNNVVCLAIGRDTLNQVLGDKVQKIKYNNVMKWSFDKSKLLGGKLTPIQIEKIITKVNILEIQQEQILIENNNIIDYIYFVLDGELMNITQKQIICQKGDFWGENYLLQGKNKEKATYDIGLIRKGVIGEIKIQEFFDCLGGELEEVLKNNKNAHEIKYMKNFGAQKGNKKSDKILLSELQLIKKLGFGQFGSVYLVQYGQELFALKCISKISVVQQNLELHTLQEKKILEAICFPMIVKFVKSFNDSNNVYFMMEYIKGMELFDVIRDIGLLSSYDSQFYTASILLCLEYLHTNKIIYRDIKPENIMVDHQGFVKLIDMGTGKFLQNGEKTTTIIGTPHYIAPEVIAGKGYNFSVDLWSLGICLYEFLCGGVPYAEDADDPFEIYEEIQKKPLQFPNFLKDSLAKQVIKQLLSKLPELRLGGSYATLKSHQWFANLDWDQLIEKQLKPPFVPPQEKLTSNDEIKQKGNQALSIMDELNKEQGLQKYDKSLAKNPDWDAEF